MTISGNSENGVYIPDGSCSATSVSTPNCNGNGIYITEASCDDCGDIKEDVDALKESVASLTTRLGVLETLIGNKTNTIIAMTDTAGNVVSVTVLAE